MSDPVDSRPASGQPADDAGVNHGTAAVRPHVGHRADHRHHRGRRHLQPADLARGLRSDQPGLDGPHHGRCARAGGVVRCAVAAATGRWRPVRVRAGRVRQRVGVHQRLVLLDHRVGGQRRDRGRLGPVRRALHQHRPQPGLLGAARAGRTVDSRSDQPVRCEEHGNGPGRDDDREVRRAGVHGDGRPVLHPGRELRSLQRQRRERHRRDRRRHGDRAVQLPRRRDGRRRGRQGARSRPEHPPGHHPGHPRHRRRLHALPHRRVRHPAHLATRRRRPRRSPTPPTPCSAAPGRAI